MSLSASSFVYAVHLLQAQVHLLRDVPLREDRLLALHLHLQVKGARFLWVLAAAWGTLPQEAICQLASCLH